MTIAIVTGSEGSGSTAATVDTATTGASLAADNTLIIYCGQGNGNDEGAFVAGNCTITSGTSGTPALAGQVNFDLGEAFARAGIWYSVKSGSTETVTAQVSAGGTPSKIHVHVCGFSSDNALEVEDTSSGSNAASDTAPSTGNMTSAGGALFTGVTFIGDSSTANPAPGTDYTLIQDTNVGGGGADNDCNSCYRIVTTGTTDAVDWTADSGNLGYVAMGTAFKEASAGGGLSIPVAMHHYKQMGSN